MGCFKIKNENPKIKALFLKKDILPLDDVPKQSNAWLACSLNQCEYLHGKGGGL